MSGAYDVKPGAASLTQSTRDAATLGAGKRTLTEQLPAGSTYQVKPGESLAMIASKLGTTPAALKAANPGKVKQYPKKTGGVVEGFVAGEQLVVPGTTSVAPAATATATPTAGPSAPEERGVLDSMLDTVHGWWDSLTGGGHEGDAKGNAGPTAATPDVKSEAKPDVKSEAKPDARGDGGKVTAPAPGTEAAPKTADAPSAAAPFADLTDAQRGAQLSTFHADELGTIDKFGMSKTGRDKAKGRNQWLAAADIKKAGNGKSGEAYADSIDALIDKTELSEDQNKVIDAAREFAASPKALSAAQAKNGVINWGKAQLTLDGVSLNEDLKSRLERYVQFLAWAGLVSGPTTIGSVMRSPQMAHKLSVAWMFNLGANSAKGSTLHKEANRQKLVANVTTNGGTDKDGNAWLSAATVDGLKAKKDDDAALFDYIKTTAAPEANKVQTQSAIAAEGYKDAERRHPNVLGGTSVSNHLLGEAVDMYPPFVFNNKFDPMIDAIAAHFGLWRAVKDDSSSPEHWHYERLGHPPGAEHDDH